MVLDEVFVLLLHQLELSVKQVELQNVSFLSVDNAHTRQEGWGSVVKILALEEEEDVTRYHGHVSIWESH